MEFCISISHHRIVLGTEDGLYCMEIGNSGKKRLVFIFIEIVNLRFSSERIIVFLFFSGEVVRVGDHKKVVQLEMVSRHADEFLYMFLCSVVLI